MRIAPPGRYSSQSSPSPDVSRETFVRFLFAEHRRQAHGDARAFALQLPPNQHPLRTSPAAAPPSALWPIVAPLLALVLFLARRGPVRRPPTAAPPSALATTTPHRPQLHRAPSPGVRSRFSQAISDDRARIAERLGGALYINDFRRLAQAAGFADPRYLYTWKTPLTDEEQAHYPDTAFATITARLMASDLTEDVCESFGETVIYKGTLPDFPDYFLFDKDIKFPTGKTCTVCGNVTGTVSYGSRYAAVFDVTGDRSQHIGDTHGDRIIKCAPDFNGVVNEDDRPIQASCC